MRVINAREVVTERAWAAVDLARIPDATVRLHWTDQPYVWHVNDTTEVFVVLDGHVNMHFRDTSGEHVTRLKPGIVFIAHSGDEHVAHPAGPARVLVIETADSI